MRRRLAVLTTGRQDWGVLRSTCCGLRQDAQFELILIVGGMHLSARHGCTEQMVLEDAFEPAARVAWIDDNADDPAWQQAGEATHALGDALERLRPEALILAGDRFETAAGALAATLARVPLVHIHGGEETEGAFDNALRHAISKMSHLHLVSHPAHAARLLAQGEDSSTIHVVGAPGLDNLRRRDLAERDELESHLGLQLKAPVVIVTLHPATLGDDPEAEARAVIDAMDCVPATYVITLPNADPGGDLQRRALLKAAGRPRRVAVEALGERRLWGLMRLADAVLGNSSGALIEAPLLGLPAVNVGQRQRGRLRAGNAIDAPAEAEAVTAALRRALTAGFRSRARAAGSPFGDGHSADRILGILKTWEPPVPPVKRWPSRIGE